MRTILALVLVLYSAAAMAQGSPPTVGGKPLVQVKPQNAAAKPKGPPQSIAKRLQACLEIEDATKGRLDCYECGVSAEAEPQGAEGEGRGGLPFHQGRRRAADMFQRIRRKHTEILEPFPFRLNRNGALDF